MWSPREEEQFVRVCARCEKRLRRYWSGWQAYDGFFVCFRGALPVRSDLDHRHEPTDVVYSFSAG